MIRALAIHFSCQRTSQLSYLWVHIHGEFQDAGLRDVGRFLRQVANGAVALNLYRSLIGLHDP